MLGCSVLPFLFSSRALLCVKWLSFHHSASLVRGRWASTRSTWRRLLRVPWTARRSNQSILKEISPGCSMEGLMLKLKLQYFGHLMRRADSFEKTLMLGKIEGLGAGGGGDNRGWNGWMSYQLNGHGFGWTPGVGDGQGGLECWGSWGRKESDTTEQPNWTEYTAFYLSIHQLMDIGLFLLFGYSEQCCSEHARTSFYVNMHCHSSWIHISRSGNIGWYGSSMLNILRNYPTVWQSGYAVLLSHKQWVRVLMSPHLHRHLLLSFLF